MASASAAQRVKAPLISSKALQPETLIIEQRKLYKDHIELGIALASLDQYKKKSEFWVGHFRPGEFENKWNREKLYREVAHLTKVVIQYEQQSWGAKFIDYWTGRSKAIHQTRRRAIYWQLQLLRSQYKSRKEADTKRYVFHLHAMTGKRAPTTKDDVAYLVPEWNLSEQISRLSIFDRLGWMARNVMTLVNPKSWRGVEEENRLKQLAAMREFVELQQLVTLEGKQAEIFRHKGTKTILAGRQLTESEFLSYLPETVYIFNNPKINVWVNKGKLSIADLKQIYTHKNRKFILSLLQNPSVQKKLDESKISFSQVLDPKYNVQLLYWHFQTKIPHWTHLDLDFSLMFTMPEHELTELIQSKGEVLFDHFYFGSNKAHVKANLFDKTLMDLGGVVSPNELLNASAGLVRILKIDQIKRLIKDKKLTLDAIASLPPIQLQMLTAEGMHNFIDSGYVTYQGALALPEADQAFLARPGVAKALSKLVFGEKHFLIFSEYRTLTYALRNCDESAREILSSPKGQELVQIGVIKSYSSIRQLSKEQVAFICGPIFRKLMSAEGVKELVKELVNDSYYGFHNLYKLPPYLYPLLRNRRVQSLIKSTYIAFDNFSKLNSNQAKALEKLASSDLLDSKDMLTFINHSFILLSDLIELQPYCYQLLKHRNFKEMHEKYLISIKDLNNFSSSDIAFACTEGITDLALSGHLDFFRIDKLREDVRTALCNSDIQAIIRENRLSVADLESLSEHEIRFICHPTRLAEFRRSRLNYTQFLDSLATPRINNDQSTHTASVHQSISQTATRLASLYGTRLDGTGLETEITGIIDFVDQLPGGTTQNDAAKRCIHRITEPTLTFEDSHSGLSIRQLLALVFIGITDESKISSSIADAKGMFIESLYEIQRGYNISASGVDNGAPDHPICLGGTFNKLVEKLQSIHPAAEVRFISKELATAKLPIVVTEEAKKFLITLTTSSAHGLAEAVRLLPLLRDDGIECIWETIKEAVATRMFDEFGSLFPSATSDEFLGFIDAGRYAELEDLSFLSTRIERAESTDATHDPEATVLFTPAPSTCSSDSEPKATL